MSARGLTAKGVPPQPAWLLYIKIAILVLALIILGLAAWSISIFGQYAGLIGASGAGGLLIFVTIKTFIIFGGIVAIEIWAPQYFYRVIALIAYILSIIFWLSAWAWAASSASFWLASYCYFGTCTSPSSYAKQEGSALAAAAAFGAVAWILSIVNLYFFVRACLDDPDGEAAPRQAELGQIKQEPTPAQTYPADQQQYAQQPHGGYPQQPGYPAQ